MEISFYLLAPFIVKRSASCIALWLTLGVAARWFVRDWLGLVDDPWSYRFFPIELPLFLWGALAFKAYQALEARAALPRELGLAALAFVLAAVWLHTTTPHLWRTGVLGVPMLCIALGPALPFLFHSTRSWRRDRWIGELSYPVHISHVAIVHLLRSAGIGDAAIGLAACALSVSFALVLRRFVEEPVERWRHTNEAERPTGARAHTERAAAIRLEPETPCPDSRLAPPW